MIRYAEAVALLRERNRPSGGIRTVHAVARDCFIRPDTEVLEIGATTGFTATNLAMLTNCSVTGIDINDQALREASDYAGRMGVAHRVRFHIADATALPFPNDRFDVVWASNVTSFISHKSRAIAEYTRVLRSRGFLVLVPIYYHRKPPTDIVRNV